MYQVTTETIEELKDDGYDVWTISLWSKWLSKMPALALAIRSVQSAFDGVTLEDGMGLREATSIDDYAGNAERQAARKLDEKTDWKNIDSALLIQCYVAPSYLDARGFLFHLPAFLIAELNDEFEFGFIDLLISKHQLSVDWIQLLTSDRSAALVETLKLLKDHPDFYNDADRIDEAIDRISKLKQ